MHVTFHKPAVLPALVRALHSRLRLHDYAERNLAIITSLAHFEDASNRADWWTIIRTFPEIAAMPHDARTREMKTMLPERDSKPRYDEFPDAERIYAALNPLIAETRRSTDRQRLTKLRNVTIVALRLELIARNVDIARATWPAFFDDHSTECDPETNSTKVRVALRRKQRQHFETYTVHCDDTDHCTHCTIRDLVVQYRRAWRPPNSTARWLFPQYMRSDSNHLSPNTVGGRTKDVLRECNIDARPHSLRGAVVDYMVRRAQRSGSHADVAAALEHARCRGGWRSLDTVMRWYCRTLANTNIPPLFASPPRDSTNDADTSDSDFNDNGDASDDTATVLEITPDDVATLPQQPQPLPAAAPLRLTAAPAAAPPLPTATPTTTSGYRAGRQRAPNPHTVGDTDDIPAPVDTDDSASLFVPDSEDGDRHGSPADTPTSTPDAARPAAPAGAAVGTLGALSGGVPTAFRAGSAAQRNDRPRRSRSGDGQRSELRRPARKRPRDATCAGVVCLVGLCRSAAGVVVGPGGGEPIAKIQRVLFLDHCWHSTTAFGPTVHL